MNSQDLKHHLAQFTGTEGYQRHWHNDKFLATDGVTSLAFMAGAGWLIDILATQPEIINGVKSNGFAVVKLIVTPDDSAILYVSQDWYGMRPVGELYSRVIEYTDFPEGEWALYLQYDGENIVCMLPSEY